MWVNVGTSPRKPFLKGSLAGRENKKLPRTDCSDKTDVTLSSSGPH